MALHNTHYKPVYTERTALQISKAIDIVRSTSAKTTILEEFDSAFLPEAALKFNELNRARALTGLILSTSGAIQRQLEVTSSAKAITKLDRAAAVLATLSADVNSLSSSLCGFGCTT